MNEKTCLSFVNAWRVTSSLLLSDVIALHTKCCVESKFSSSHPPGLLWLEMQGGETIHGHYDALCAEQICELALTPLPSVVFVIYFTVFQFSDLMTRKTAYTANNLQRPIGREKGV